MMTKLFKYKKKISNSLEYLKHFNRELPKIRTIQKKKITKKTIGNDLNR